ncbi:MAG TPA: hypothetical protein RMH99_23890 [Sandaracinaceae bacterium LLY-WYZ-13_1]|nr:hypothetical protein [Sandaracinaceae bacterium LLY-WYZ-13_1]
MDDAPCTFTRAESDGGNLTIDTVGLADAGQRELQMVDVPELLAPVAERFLAELGTYATRKKALEADETIGVPTHFGANFARLVERGPSLRVVDVMEDAPTDAAPRLVLATELFEEAFQRYQRGEMQVAAQLLDTSIETYPGSSGRPDLGSNVNNENFRAYLLLYSLTGDAAHLERALERSASFQIEQLGAPAEMLAGRLGDAEKVSAQVELVRKVRLGVWDRMLEESPEAVEPEVAPMPQPQLHTNAEGGLDTALSLVPTAWAEAFYQGVGRAAVEHEDAVDLVTEILVSHRDSLAALVGKLREGAMLWGTTEMDRGPLPPPMDRSSGLEHLITGVLAQIGLLAEIGLDAEARRAWFGLDAGAGPSDADRARVGDAMAERERTLVAIVRAAQQPPG